MTFIAVESICSQCTFSLPPENRKLPHLSIHWLIMRVGFEIKGSKPKSSMNRLNLFKVLIFSSTSFLKGCAIWPSDSSCWFSLSLSVITSAGCSENSGKKNSCPCCWTIVPVTIEHSDQWWLNNLASDCSTILLVTAEDLCQWLMKN